MIDTTDYSILKCLHDADRSLWKKRVYQEFNERQDVLPITEAASLQTVGRRVDRLYDDGHLENAIVSPQDVARDMIIGYTLTPQGRKAMDEKRTALLQEIAGDEIFGGDERPEMDGLVLAELISDELEIGEESSTLHENYGRNELLAFIGTYLIKKQTAALTEDDIQQFRDSLVQHQPPSAVLQ